MNDNEKTINEKTLTQGQLQAIAAFHRGDSLVVTGPAGVGKSYLVSEISRQAALNNQSIGLTSMTGTSAISMGGVTVHSYLGIGLGVDPVHILHKKLQYNMEASYRYNVDILVIDEISMMTRSLFDTIEHLARLMRRNSSFFGGIQLVLMGDLFQLAPVNYQEHGYITESEVFKQNFNKDNIIIMNEIIRQKDISMQQFLNEIRVTTDSSKLSSGTLSVLDALSNKSYPESEIRPTRLYSHRADSSAENARHLASLKGESYTIMGVTRCVFKRNGSNTRRTCDPDIHIKKMDKSCNTSAVLSFKVGAQVMITKNIDQDSGIVNGSRGVITSVSQLSSAATDTTVHVKLMNGRVYPVSCQKWEMKIDDNVSVVREQIPLMLAYAYTIHMCQGATLDCVCVDITRVFEYGQVYTALSRTKTMEGTYLNGYNKGTVMKLANPSIVSFINGLYA